MIQLRDIIVRDEDGYIIRCSQCSSGNVVKNGHQTEAQGKRQRYKCLDCKCTRTDFLKLDPENLKANIRLARDKQRLQDSNRIERKAWRGIARLDNALKAYNEAIIQRLDDIDLGKFTLKHAQAPNGAVGMLQLSDLHLNELVHRTHQLHNQYDFTIASKRLKLLAIKAVDYFMSVGVSKVVLALTGDMINSDRRMDEMLHMATNRSDASLLAVELLSQFILDLNQDFDIEVVNVSGNESRMTEWIEYNELLARDNYDWTIFNFLSREFKNSEGVKFIKDLDARQNVIQIAGQNVLVMHGEKLPMEGGVEKEVIRLMGQWSNKGVKIDFVIFGHFHSARVADTYGRSSSLVGANAYSEDGLHLISLASQNAYIFYPNGERDHIRFGLQYADGIKGYDIINELVAYNAKSANKMKERTTIIKIQI